MAYPKLGEHIVVYSQPITDIIRRRFSCRAHLAQPIDAELQRQLQAFMRPLRAGPLGAPARFELVAASEQGRQSLKGLGTYGFIRGAAGFIVGAAGPGAKNLEDYGYLLEGIILRAAELELGTCWLGGFFTKSSFAKKISAQPGELLPAVASVGYIEHPEVAREALMRRRLGANQRLPWARLFFSQKFGSALAPEAAGVYRAPLEMVRLGPSASNKQPWRVVWAGRLWHFYLQRSPGYQQAFFSRLLKVDDLQRVDIGIAMCHFELAARELGLAGQWQVSDPTLELPDELTEYVVSWRPA
jgi:nitroreductase